MLVLVLRFTRDIGSLTMGVGLVNISIFGCLVTDQLRRKKGSHYLFFILKGLFLLRYICFPDKSCRH